MLEQEVKATMYDLYLAWCREQGRNPSDDASMKAFLADVFTGPGDLDG